MCVHPKVNERSALRSREFPTTENSEARAALVRFYFQAYSVFRAFSLSRVLDVRSFGPIVSKGFVLRGFLCAGSSTV